MLSKRASRSPGTNGLVSFAAVSLAIARRSCWTTWNADGTHTRSGWSLRRRSTIDTMPWALSDTMTSGMRPHSYTSSS